ncbi:hypothetical protein [Acidipila rosea]|uniref:hypothetical protein n=1 Tax=Acidipila rosea TaxID=768535 RepID=UPI001050F670|nr:hypothetical protein [Acidipila rosea]MBW4025769.1 hypothetical protein [Acidobacteriota bacterium]MBW4044312.1 hypothetical protein [Acidobacteriota bacterium]
MKLLLLLALAASPLAAHAQGCSLCRDTTAGSSPRAQQGLRRAIPVLGVPAAGIFISALVIARRIKPGD